MVPTGREEEGGRKEEEIRVSFEPRSRKVRETKTEEEEHELWLILSKRPLQAFFSMTALIRTTLATVKSSPTTWVLVAAVR